MSLSLAGSSPAGGAVLGGGKAEVRAPARGPGEVSSCAGRRQGRAGGAASSGWEGGGWSKDKPERKRPGELISWSLGQGARARGERATGHPSDTVPAPRLNPAARQMPVGGHGPPQHAPACLPASVSPSARNWELHQPPRLLPCCCQRWVLASPGDGGAVVLPPWAAVCSCIPASAVRGGA